ncbi:MAG TPA: hypothetical protein VGB18_08815, partial [Candidatus Thermoplasmatota archaeon]
AAPATPVTDYVDLTGLRVYDETMDGIRIAVQLKTLSKPPGSLIGHNTDIRFGAQSTPPVSYLLRWTEDYDFITPLLDPTNTNNTFHHYPSFCFYGASDQRGNCLPQRVVGWIDFESTELVAFIPKSSLQGLDPLRPEFASSMPISMPAGTALGNFSVESSGDFWGDRLPDSGDVGPYVLQQPTANERLRLRLFTNETAEPGYGPSHPGGSAPYMYAMQETDFPHVSIEPGAPFPVPIEIRNLNGAKRLVNLTLEFDDPKQAPKWPVRLAPSLQVPGNETRIVNLIVNATNEVQHRDEALVRVIGRAVGFPDEIGTQTLKLVASVPPSPTQQTLFLHALPFPMTPGSINSCEFPGPFGDCTGAAILNTVEKDEAATADEAPVVNDFTSLLQGGTGPNAFTSGTSRAFFNLEQPLARDLVLDTTKESEGAIRIGTTQPFEGSLTVNLHAGDIFIGSATVPVAPNSLQEPIPFTFIPMIGSERIPRDSVITLNIEIVYSYVGTSAALLLEPPGVIPSGSFFALPIIPDPRANNLSIAGDNGLISLTVKGDRDDFVNPGESRAFNVTLVNEAADTDNINITGFVEAGKCAIQIKPGQRFHLEGGDSVRLGVLLRAHSEAKEGDRCQARIQATSEATPGTGASLLLEAIVTNGIDLEDDSENYTADAESAQKLQHDNPNGTPGLGFAGSLAAAIGVFAWRRRRGDA